jgi:AmiR/NasT family two-component response regulator
MRERAKSGVAVWQRAGEPAGLEIVAAVRPDDHRELLVRSLQRTRAVVRCVWPMPERLPESADAIFCELVPQLVDRVPWLPGQPRAALVVVIPAAEPADVPTLQKCAPDAVLPRPFTANSVVATLMVARSSFLYGQRLRLRIEKLDDTLRSIRNVERAKTILMRTRRLEEEEAYHFMRRQAMSKRVPIGTIATAIVDSDDVLGYDFS